MPGPNRSILFSTPVEVKRPFLPLLSLTYRLLYKDGRVWRTMCILSVFSTGVEVKPDATP